MHVLRLRRLAAACRLPFALVLVLFVSTPVLFAATITGRVVDPDGRAVPAARVFIANATGTVADRPTDDRGMFDMPKLTAGQYEIRVMAEG